MEQEQRFETSTMVVLCFGNIEMWCVEGREDRGEIAPDERGQAPSGRRPTASVGDCSGALGSACDGAKASANTSSPHLKVSYWLTRLGPPLSVTSVWLVQSYAFCPSNRPFKGLWLVLTLTWQKKDDVTCSRMI